MGRSNIMMCPHCLNAYYKSQLVPNTMGSYNCPNYACSNPAHLFDIDELMYEPIRELNRKGYRTNYCCSGHYEDPFGYISFYDPTYMPNTDNLPDGWYLDEEHWCIRNNEHGLAKKMEDLYNWIKALPNWVKPKKCCRDLKRRI